MNIDNRRNAKDLIAIEYPGNVQNPEKMVETLGGIEELSKGFQEKQKLQLKFRNNFYAKPALSSEPNESTGMLLKVKIRRSKKNLRQKPECVSTELVGVCSTLYKFNNFADYQFLPIQRNEKTGKTENIYNDIVPSDITVGPAWFRDKLDVPVFLPPVAFTRSDTIQPTVLKNEIHSHEDEETIKFAVTNRLSRATHGISIPFSMMDPIPLKANDAVHDPAQSSLLKPEEYEAVLALFKERPICTLGSIRAHMRTPPRRLNHVLATMAYYYSTGPWRNCFVAFGYDPRKNFESRFYQMLDFRVRQGAGFKEDLQFRRHKGGNRRVKVPAKAENGAFGENEIEENYQSRRKLAIFTNDTIPSFRALHYQFIDIQVPKIQEMLHKIPSTFSGASCNEKRGWLPAGFMEQCRDILTSIAHANMLKHCNDKNISIEEFKSAEDKSDIPAGDEEAGDSDESTEDIQEQELDEMMEE